MLFHVTWKFTDTTEEGQRRNLKVFGGWQPPSDVEFKGFFGNSDGSGGVAIVDTESAASLARTTGPFTPWLHFTVTPIIPIEEAAGIAGEAAQFRDSVS